MMITVHCHRNLHCPQEAFDLGSYRPVLRGPPQGTVTTLVAGICSDGPNQTETQYVASGPAQKNPSVRLCAGRQCALLPRHPPPEDAPDLTLSVRPGRQREVRPVDVHTP